MKYSTKLSALTILCAIVLIAAASSVYAAKGKKNRQQSKQTKIWQPIDKSSLQSRGNELAPLPDKVPVYSLNRLMLNDILNNAPLEFTDAARQTSVVLEILNPEGKLVRFRLEESPMLAPEVAAQFPTWKTFSGQGIDDPTATARFDTNANGFHGYVTSANGTFLIDPYSLTDQKNYIVYYKGDLGGNPQSFSCKIGGGGKVEDAELSSPSAPQAFSNGTQLRTYRLAVSATQQYTNFFGGNRNAAFAAIQTTVNRMIGIYRRELAATFSLISDTRSVFDNGNNGGFDNSSSQGLTRNQVVLDTIYGNTAYDIGHVFSVTPKPDGLATSPSLCDNRDKAQGFTGAPTPQGDGYDVDYVAHEIGHQFGMSHTFNNDVDDSCGTRSITSAYEPASGITIMAYAGICAPRNLAQNSIEFFNLRSFDQSLNYLQQISNSTNVNINPNCGTPTANGNIAPTVTSPGDFVIPRLTPFTLTATATDPNGDTLTYSWEEFDLNANGATGSVPNPNVPSPTNNNPNPTRNNTDVDSDENGTIRPIFRAYNPMASSSRTFPSLNYILNPANNDAPGSNQPSLTYTGTLPNAPTSGSTNGYVCAPTETCVRGERLPAISRTMTFRATVRDNRAGGGGIADAQSTVTIAGSAGPFQVTNQNSSPVAWRIGTTQTVTWDVANTGSGTTVNAANVSILLSTDGGLTFPITLAANTPNDGTQDIAVPRNPTATARIKVQAVGNIFFDINNVNFQISPPTAAAVFVTGRVLSAKGTGISKALVTLTDRNGAVHTVRTNLFGDYRFDNVAAGQTAIFSVSHKRYQFSPQAVFVAEDLSELDFIAGN